MPGTMGLIGLKGEEGDVGIQGYAIVGAEGDNSLFH